MIMYAALLATTACQERSREQGNAATMAAAETTAAEIPVDTMPAVSRDTIPYNIQVDSVIHLSFPKDSTGVSVKGYLDKDGGPVICYMQVAGSGWLHAGLVPEKKNANIRFSHIYKPDGESDGPFGQTLKYRLAAKGMYKLYIAPNQMAGDKREGNDFTLTVRVR